MEHQFYMMVVCPVLEALLLLILPFHGWIHGCIHEVVLSPSGTSVGKRWNTAGGSWAYLGPVGVGRPYSEAVWAHLWLVHSLWDPYVDNGVHGVKLSWHVMWAY